MKSKLIIKVTALAVWIFQAAAGGALAASALAPAPAPAGRARPTAVPHELPPPGKNRGGIDSRSPEFGSIKPSNPASLSHPTGSIGDITRGFDRRGNEPGVVPPSELHRKFVDILNRLPSGPAALSEESIRLLMELSPLGTDPRGHSEHQLQLRSKGGSKHAVAFSADSQGLVRLHNNLRAFAAAQNLSFDEIKERFSFSTDGTRATHIFRVLPNPIPFLPVKRRAPVAE